MATQPIILTQNMDELKRRIIELEESVQTLSDNLREDSVSQFPRGGNNLTLSSPVDSITKKTINSLVPYPIVVRLKSTDAATAANYGTFFTANESCIVVAVTEVHGTLGTDVGAVTLQLEKLTGTTAPDSGTTLLSSAFNLKATINTVQYGSLVATGETILSRGDRLCLKDSGTLTAVANVQVTVYIQLL